MSAMMNSGLKGMTAQAASAGIKSSNGESKKKNRSALSGIITSFSSNLIVSAIDCNVPFGPTRFGPILACM